MIGTASSSRPPARNAIESLPVGTFGAVMGLSGLSVAWKLAANRHGWPTFPADALAALAALVFVVLGVAYLMKLVTRPDRVRAEFVHPVSGSLFGTIFVSMLLLPIVIVAALPGLAFVVWSIGTVGMVSFAWLLVDRWMSDRQQVAHVAPTWLVPVVGMLDIPLAMPSLGLESMQGLMVAGLAIGLFFAVPLFTMIFARLVFESPLPDPLQPTLMILLAPFAVGTSAYIATTGHVDLFARALFALTIFLLAVLVGRVRYFARCCPFRVAWWAVSFPLAAAAVAAFRIAAAEQRGGVYDALALALLALATAVIAWLVVRTVAGALRGAITDLWAEPSPQDPGDTARVTG